MHQTARENLRAAVKARVTELVQGTRSRNGRSDTVREGKILWGAVGNRWGGIVRGDRSLTFSVNNPASITPYNAGKFPLHVYKGGRAASLGNFDSPEKAKAHAEKWLRGDRFEIEHFEAVTEETGAVELRIYRNIIKNVSLGRAMAIAEEKAKETGETWYVFGDMVANARGRKGYEQYEALAYHPGGRIEQIPAQPRPEAVTTGSMSSVTKDTRNLILANDEEEQYPVQEAGAYDAFLEEAIAALGEIPEALKDLDRHLVQARYNRAVRNLGKIKDRTWWYEKDPGSMIHQKLGTLQVKMRAQTKSEVQAAIGAVEDAIGFLERMKEGVCLTREQVEFRYVVKYKTKGSNKWKTLRKFDDLQYAKWAANSLIDTGSAWVAAVFQFKGAKADIERYKIFSPGR